MTMSPGVRSLALTTHVVSSVGWLGAVVAYLALVLAALSSQDVPTARAAWLAMEVIASSAIVPLCLASLLTGVIQALGTPWGLFRHYWVLIKLLLTVLATIVLLLHVPTVSFQASVLARTNTANLGGLWGELLHAGGGLVVLLLTTTLSVFKPRGMTPYGWRKQHERELGS